MARLTISSIGAIEDGYPLEVAHYHPFDKRHTEVVVIINSGAGISKSLYEPFACWLADHGVSVIAYDYRGIGGSRSRRLKGFRASIRDWGSKDCAAVVKFARVRFPRAKLCILAHSIGAVVTGFVSNPPEIAGILMLSPHTGFAGDYARSSRYPMFMLWHVFMPIITRFAGFFPGKALGLSENLPFEVASEWASRRFAADVRSDLDVGKFVHIRSDALIVRPTDDPFATETAAWRIRTHFPNTHFSELAIETPNRTKIGHFGFFGRRSRETLWPLALKWFIQR